MLFEIRDSTLMCVGEIPQLQVFSITLRWSVLYLLNLKIFIMFWGGKSRKKLIVQVHGESHLCMMYRPRHYDAVRTNKAKLLGCKTDCLK